MLRKKPLWLRLYQRWDNFYRYFKWRVCRRGYHITQTLANWFEERM